MEWKQLKNPLSGEKKFFFLRIEPYIYISRTAHPNWPKIMLGNLNNCGSVVFTKDLLRVFFFVISFSLFPTPQKSDDDNIHMMCGSTKDDDRNPRKRQQQR